MTVAELREALSGYPDDAPVQIHVERPPNDGEETFVVNVQPIFAGWSESEHKPHVVLFGEPFPQDYIEKTRDRVVERSREFTRWSWPYGRFDWWNAPQWKRTFGRGRA